MSSTVSVTWEDTLTFWAKPPAKTEQERCENAERAVRNAISASSKLKSRNIKVFSLGSYRNNTNVRNDSDVDLGVLCYDTFFFNLPEGCTREQFGIGPGTYAYEEFKNDVGQALLDYFGSRSVHRGNKAFDIHENSYHVDADVTPFFEHRRYSADGTYLSGVELLSDDFNKIINWPEQHYQNGVAKNEATSKRFKSLVRILKVLCNRMSDENIEIAKKTPSFLIESLVWNVPNSNFGHYTYTDDLRACLAYLFNNTLDAEKCSNWGEVSDLKYLFRGPQKWTWEQAHAFLSTAWDYMGFE